MLKDYLRQGKRFVFRLTSWIIKYPQASVFAPSLVLIGTGLGWWIHPGCGLMVTGAIPLSLMIYGHTMALRKKAEDA